MEPRLIMDFIMFNNFVVFINYYFFNFMITLDTFKINHQPTKQLKKLKDNKLKKNLSSLMCKPTKPVN